MCIVEFNPLTLTMPETIHKKTLVNLSICISREFYFHCFLGAWPVLIDEFVEFAKPRLTPGKQTTV